MTRAKPLPPEERRRALIEATIPLLLEHGMAVSTRQVAEAAGVAEGTIFRVFGSKDDLVHAAITQALSTDDLGGALDALPPDTDLEKTLLVIVEALLDNARRMRTLFGIVRKDAHHAHPTPPRLPEGFEKDGPLRCPRPDPRAIHREVSSRIAAALLPHADHFRTTPEVVASTLISMTLGSVHPLSGEGEHVTPAAVVDLLLHGITKEA